MKLLLDSNVLLWAVYEPEKLTKRVASLVADESNDLLVSQASIWELLEKIGRGRLLMAGTSVDHAMQRFLDFGVVFVPIQLAHIISAAQLPQYHQDPFDRLIIAQATALAVPVLTSDRAFAPYGVEVIW